MGAGLFSSLALSTSMATSVLMGGAPPPEAPNIPDQVISSADEVQQSSESDQMEAQGASTASHKYSAQQSAPKKNYAPNSTTSADISEMLTGNSSTLSDISSPQGVDIASHQHSSRGSIDIPTVVDDGGMKFAFIKATEGTHYTNPHFRGDVMKFRDKDVPVGFYHYAKPSTSTDDAQAQAKYFVERTGIDKGVKSFNPVLDIEESNGVDSSADLIAWTQAFVDEVKSLTGKDVMIYTYPSFWRNAMGNTTQFSNLPLWIAHYNNSTAPGTPLPGGWDNWVFWQYTSDGSVDGYSQKIDMNLFNGSTKQLKKLYDNSGASSTGKKTSSAPTTTVTVTVPAPALDE